MPVDVSEEFLEATALQLQRRLSGRSDHAGRRGHHRAVRAAAGRESALFAFLGSTIGNFARERQSGCCRTLPAPWGRSIASCSAPTSIRKP